MNMRVEAQLGDIVDPLTQEYDAQFFERYRIQESGETPVFALIKHEIGKLQAHSAFDAFSRTAESRVVLDPFLRHLQYLEGSVYEVHEKGKAAQYLNDAFDAAMESLVRADWKELGALGADWNQVCGAIKEGLETMARLYGAEDQVESHIEGWFSFYRQYGMSLSQQRKKRVQLNKMALDYHKNIAFTSMNRENTRNAEQVMGEMKEELGKVQQEIDAMGVDPDEQYAGAFTTAAQVVKSRKALQEQKALEEARRAVEIARFRKEEEEKTDQFFVPSLYASSLAEVGRKSKGPEQIDASWDGGSAPQQEEVTYKSKWVLEPKPQPEPEPQGFFGKMWSKAKKKVSGWFGR